MTDDETYPDEYRIPGFLGTRPGFVTIHLVPGTPVTGLWCDTCLLPSRYEIPIYVLGDEGPIKTGMINRCREHPL